MIKNKIMAKLKFSSQLYIDFISSNYYLNQLIHLLLLILFL